MPATYEPIATTTLGSATNSITFSSIPSTYTDLRIIWVPSGVSSTATPGLRFNGASGVSYATTFVRGNGTDVSTGKFSDNLIYLSGSNSIPSSTSTVFIAIDIFSYTNSLKKSCLSLGSFDRNGAGAAVATLGWWDNTAAITSVTVLLNSNNQNVGTTATLYGIKAA